MSQEEAMLKDLKNWLSNIYSEKKIEYSDPIKESLWGYFCNKFNENLKIDHHGHENTLIEFIGLLVSGKKPDEILAKEAKDYKYSFERKFEGLKNEFFVKIEEALLIFMLKSESEEDFSDDKILKSINYCCESFYKYKKCDKCGSVLIKKEHCVMDISIIQSVDVHFETGELVVADWLRDNKNLLSNLTSIKNTEIGKELSKKDSYAVEYGDTNLNEYAQVLSAAEKNVVTVFVGNTCPSVYSSQEKIIIANDINSNLREVAKVCTDLWRATIVDKQTLVNMVADKIKEDNREKVMCELMKNTNTFKVKPGKYRLHYNVEKNGMVQHPKYGHVYFYLEFIE